MGTVDLASLPGHWLSQRTTTRFHSLIAAESDTFRIPSSAIEPIIPVLLQHTPVV